MRAPNPIDIVDVIAIPRLTLFFGRRLLPFGACAAAKVCHEQSKRADNFQAGQYVFHALLIPDALESLLVPLPSKIYKFLLPDILWISSHVGEQDEMLDVRTIVRCCSFRCHSGGRINGKGGRPPVVRATVTSPHVLFQGPGHDVLVRVAGECG